MDSTPNSSKRSRLEDSQGSSSSAIKTANDSPSQSTSINNSPNKRKKPKGGKAIIYVGINNEISVIGAKKKDYYRFVEFRMQTQEQQNNYYRIGAFRVILERNHPDLGEKMRADLTKNNLMEKFPRLTAIKMQVKGDDDGSSNLIKFLEEREINEDEAQELLKDGHENEFAEIKRKNQRVVLKKELVVGKFEKLNVPAMLFAEHSYAARNIFQLEFERYDAVHKEFKILVNLITSAVIADPSYDVRNSVYMENCCSIFDHSFHKTTLENEEKRPIDFEKEMKRFYAITKEYHDREDIPEPEFPVQPPDLLVELLEYQKQTVSWMLKREGVTTVDGENVNLQETLQTQMSYTVSLYQNERRVKAYYFQPTGAISLQREQVKKFPPGGILAEEMGLGKTIETVALILLNPRAGSTEHAIRIEDINEEDDPKPSTSASASTIDLSFLDPISESNDFKKFECKCGQGPEISTNEILTCSVDGCKISHHGGCFGFDAAEIEAIRSKQNYKCPFCIAVLPPIPSNGTLIIVPESILQQWDDEIATNVVPDKLKVHAYGGSAKTYLHPLLLAKNDIVLTTYEILHVEFDFDNLPKKDKEIKKKEILDQRLRRKSRYIGRPSPLTSIQWWRVCLDEAQKVETVDSKFAKMVLRIPTIHRWCITGTPFKDKFDDLFGIVMFLGIEPISEKVWWDSLISKPFRRNDTTLIHLLFGQIFWRTAREDVQDEMKLTRQTKVIHTLRLSPVEMHFYKERYKYWLERCGISLEESRNKMQLDGEMLLQQPEFKFPLTRLRQICSHPQLDEEIFSYVQIFKEGDTICTLNSSEFTGKLVLAARNKFQGNYNSYVATLNALGDIYQTKDEIVSAEKMYKKVLELAENEDYKDLVTCDSELFHALRNLTNLATSRNQHKHYIYEQQTNLLRAKLLSKGEDVKILTDEIIRMENDNRPCLDVDPWWAIILDHVVADSVHSSKLIPQIIEILKKYPRVDVKIKTEGKTRQSNPCNYTALNPNCLDEVKEMLKNHVELLNSRRDELFEAWKNCLNEKLFAMLANSTTCHLQNNPAMHMRTCSLCRLTFEKIPTYEHSLYNIVGNIWSVSIYADILKAIFNYARKELKHVKKLGATLQSGFGHLELIDEWKKETKLFHKWVNSKKDQIKELDSLEKSAMPIGLNTNSNSLKFMEEVQLRIDQENDNLAKWSEKLESTSKIYKYLVMLQKYEGGRIGYFNMDPCGMSGCDGQLKNKWGFLPCGHSCVCENCLRCDYVLCTNSKCLRTFPKNQIQIIDTISSNHEIHNWIIEKKADIFGKPLTKVEAIIRTLLSIKDSTNDVTTNEPVKSIVISNWPPMLIVLHHELKLNQIDSILYKKGKNRHDILKKFKASNGPNVLLMPLSVAATGGLNLTQASHILLVDPIINLTWEQQAISRIHRLGQKNETYVHRFFIIGTVEEQIERSDPKQRSVYEEGNLSMEEVEELFQN